jgi:nicotinamidase-related amidase
MSSLITARSNPLQPPPTLAPARPGRTALVLVHCQRWLTEADGWLPSRAAAAGFDLCPFRSGQAQAAQAAAGLLAAARRVDLDILHVAAGALLPDFADVPDLFPICLWQHDTQAAFWPQVAPEAGELVLATTSFSPFSTTDIERKLANLGIEQVIVAGALTNGAVELTALDARDRGFEVVVVEDACVALNADLHASALARLQHCLVAVLPVTTVVAHLDGTQAWPEFPAGAAARPFLGQLDDPWLRICPPAAPGPMEPATTALVTVDMQYLNAHRDHGSGLQARLLGLTDFDGLFAAIEALLPALGSLQAAARRAGLRLVHLRTACQTPDWRDSGRGRRPSRRPMAALGTHETEFLAGFEPQPGELVVSKTSWGPFNSTPLERLLRQLGCRSLLVAGVVTNGCVEMTVRDALDRGFRVTLITDATAARREDIHCDALSRMAAAGARLADTASVLGQLARLKPA